VAVYEERILSAGRARHGDHLCCAFDLAAQQEELVIEFVRAGLEHDDRVWYFADTNEPQYVLDTLRRAGINVDHALDHGQLTVFSAESSYLTELPFSPPRMLESVHGAVDDAVGTDGDGAPWLRLAGEGDYTSMAELARALADALAEHQDVHIDASRLEFVELSGARWLIDAAARLRSKRRIVLHQPRRAVRGLFEILGERGQAVELVA
jgi:anti-anti-sigma regulatory factor